MFHNAAVGLCNQRDVINELNVFPVPDGDTGTNMSLTMDAAAAAVAVLPDDAGIPELFATVARASLKGARGNSGVILSQLFRGMEKVARGITGNMSAAQFAQALKEGSDTVYKAVMKPTEGTMLTIIRESANYALHHVQGDLRAFVADIGRAAQKALDHTPNQLPILKQAGVVDAGGKGICVILDGFLQAIDGVELSRGSVSGTIEIKAAATDIAHIYCTEFLILKYSANASALPFREAIDVDCDSLLVIDDGDIVKVHIHTNNPGDVLRHAVKLGELSNIKIDNMKEQHNERFTGPVGDTRPYGVVAVASGKGLHELLGKLGADRVVDGGQSSNPSTEEIQRAVQSVNASDVFILPCNKNIIGAARQVEGSDTRRVHVIGATTIPQGIAAMLAFDPTDDVEGNARNMYEAIGAVKSGSVTTAVRGSMVGMKRISKGDYLGVNEQQITVVGKELARVCADLVAELYRAADDPAIITLYYGCDVTSDVADALAKQLAVVYDECDVVVHDGGQPLYPFIISVE